MGMFSFDESQEYDDTRKLIINILSWWDEFGCDINSNNVPEFIKQAILLKDFYMVK